LRKDAERNRLLILSSARTLFAQRGLDATLDEVAREAGLGVGTVYRHFPNRDALIDALFADGMDALTRVVDEAVAMPRAWDGLRYFMYSALEMQSQDRGLRDVMFSRRTAADQEHDLMAQQLKPPLDALVQRAKDEGDLRPDLSATDVAVLELAALGAAEFTVAVAPDAWRRHLAIMLDGMRARPDGEFEPLVQPALDHEQLETCMIGWKYGSRETRRQRSSQRS
jgi:AcrR family transcriptional regulator